MKLTSNDLFKLLDDLSAYVPGKDVGMAAHVGMQYAIYAIPKPYEKGLPKQFYALAEIHFLAPFAHSKFVNLHDRWLAHRIILEYKDGSLQVFVYPTSNPVEKQFLLDVYQNMLCDGAQVEMGFIEPKDTPGENERIKSYWMNNELSYIEKEKLAYNKLRPVFFDQYRRFLMERGGLSDVETLMSVGSGKGDCVMAALNYFTAKNVILIDLSTKNLDPAQAVLAEKIPKNTQVKTFVDEHTSLLKISENNCVDKSKSIGFAIGCLTHNVNEGSRSAILCVQQAFRSCNAFAVAGYTQPLLSIEMLHKTGWMPLRIQHDTNPTSGTPYLTSMYFMAQPTSDERQHYIMQAEKNGKLLDFYLCADPFLYLSEMKLPMEDITIIDLRFAYFKSKSELDEFLEVLSGKLPNLKYIRAEFDDNWLNWLLVKKFLIGGRKVRIKVMERKGPKTECHIRKCLVSEPILRAICVAENPKLSDSLGATLMAPSTTVGVDATAAVSAKLAPLL